MTTLPGRRADAPPHRTAPSTDALTWAKVPAIGAMFWAIKLITTGVGEAASDFMGQHSIPIAAAVGIGGTALAFRLQYRRPDYHPPTYWFAVLMVAVFGTMVADGIKDGAGIPYSVTTPLFAAAVAVVFWRWYRSEGTLSIHSITTRRRENYYWLAVLSTFALGTAAGDLTAIQLHWGYFASAGLFAVLMAIPAVAWSVGLLSPVAAFWSCYVLTRPLGASFADGFSKPHVETGLGLGDGLVTLLGLAAFAALVTWVTRTGSDRQAAREVEAHEPSAAEALHVSGAGLATESGTI